MKTFSDYINEKQNFIFGGKANLSGKEYINATYFPSNLKELGEIIEKLIKERGDDGDLNDIDVSALDSLAYVFSVKETFNCDISQWDTSGIVDMESTFDNCYEFNQDISGWDVSNVENMDYMFYACREFCQDLSKWDVSKVKSHDCIFSNSPMLVEPDYMPKFKKF